MAAKADDAPALHAATPADSSDPGPDPAVYRLLVEKGTEEEEEEEEEREENKEREARPREAKRRRTCPAALETTTSSVAAAATAEEEEDGESSGAARGEFSFSFSFDAKGVPPIETTPKFGSFRFPAADLGLGGAAVVATEAGGTEEREDGVGEGKIGDQ